MVEQKSLLMLSLTCCKEPKNRIYILILSMIDWNKQMINNGITLVAVFSIGVIAKFIFAINRPQCFVSAGYNITRSI